MLQVPHECENETFKPSVNLKSLEIAYRKNTEGLNVYDRLALSVDKVDSKLDNEVAATFVP